MDIEQVSEYALSLFGVTEDQPFGDDVVTFRVEGKIFLCLWLGGSRLDMKGENPRFACKLAPERNEALRERYAAVTPAFSLEQEALERRVLWATCRRNRNGVDKRVV